MSARPDHHRPEDDPSLLLEEYLECCGRSTAPDPHPFLARAGARVDDLHRRLEVLGLLERAMELIYRHNGPRGLGPRFRLPER